jgi:hypothetical protein
MNGTLDISTTATHEVLRERLREAIAGHAVARRSRQDYPHTDTFLASTSRHLAAVSAALLPQARHALPDGAERTKEFVRQCRRLEVCLAQIKAKLYGEAHAIHRGWSELWSDVRHELGETLRLERQLVDDLVEALGEERCDALASAIYHQELHAPTRPHPYSPHQGVPGRMARRVLTTVDHFWDATEGRMVPEPVHPRDHSHDGLLTHYLLADADPDPDAEPREQ